MKNRVICVANLGQWLSLIMLVIATIFMMVKKEEFTATLITASAVVFAIATKMKYYTKEKDRRMANPIHRRPKGKGRFTHAYQIYRSRF